MNGPTEREQRTLAILDKYDVTRTNAVWRDILCDLVAAADRESAALRARVAVLEQQIAAIKSAVDRVGLSDSNRIANVHVILAAGVVDNPTEPGKCIACGEAHDDGPTDSTGNVWCGECYREATP